MRLLKIICCLICLSACSSSPRIEQGDNGQTYVIKSLRGATTKNDAYDWRRKEGIPLDALIAIYPDKQVEILKKTTRVRYIAPSMDTYVNDFVHCYLHMDGFVNGRAAIIQAPCKRDTNRYHRFGGGFGAFHSRHHSGWGFSIGTGFNDMWLW